MEQGLSFTIKWDLVDQLTPFYKLDLLLTNKLNQTK